VTSAGRVRHSARGSTITAVVRVDSRIGFVGHVRGVNTRSRAVLVVAAVASHRVINSGINAIGGAGRVNGTSSVRRGVVSVHPGLLGHAGGGGSVAGRDVCVSGAGRSAVATAGRGGAVVVGAQAVRASACGGGLVGVIGRGDVRGGVAYGGGGGRLSVTVLVVELVGDLVHETHD